MRKLLKKHNDITLHRNTDLSYTVRHGRNSTSTDSFITALDLYYQLVLIDIDKNR